MRPVQFLFIPPFNKPLIHFIHPPKKLNLLMPTFFEDFTSSKEVVPKINDYRLK